MYLDDFEKNIKTIQAWFRKTLTKDQLEMMFHQLKYIPAAAFLDIVKDIMNEKSPNPGNFPTINQLKSAWFAWQLANPQKIQRRDETRPCDDCRGHGVLWWREWDKISKMNIHRVVRCASCTNWRKYWASNSKGMESTRADLEDAGHLVWPWIPSDYKLPRDTSVQDMIDNVGQELPF